MQSVWEWAGELLEEMWDCWEVLRVTDMEILG